MAIPEFTTTAVIDGNTKIENTDDQIKILMADVKAYLEANINNYSADEILAKLKTVDGAGSELDADTVRNFIIARNVPADAVFTDTTYSVGNNGLTEKNFTEVLKNKLDNIEAEAEKNVVVILEGDTPDFSVIPIDGSVKKVIWNHPQYGGAFFYDANAGADDYGMVFSKWVRRNPYTYVKLDWFPTVKADGTTSDFQAIQDILNLYPKIKAGKDKTYRIDSTANLEIPDYGYIDLNGSEFISSQTGGSVIDTIGAFSIINGKVLYNGADDSYGIKPKFTADDIDFKADYKRLRNLDVDVSTGTSTDNVGVYNAIELSALHHSVGDIELYRVNVLGAAQSGFSITAHNKDANGNLFTIDSLTVKNCTSNNTGIVGNYGLGLTVSGMIKKTSIDGIDINDYKNIGLESASTGQYHAKNVKITNIKDPATGYAIQASTGIAANEYGNLTLTLDNIIIEGGGRIKVASFPNGSGVSINNMTADGVILYYNTGNTFNNCTFTNLSGLYKGSVTARGVFNNTSIEFADGSYINTDYAEKGHKLIFNDSTVKCWQGDFQSPESGEVDAIAIGQKVWNSADSYLYEAVVDTNILGTDGLPNNDFSDTNSWTKTYMGHVVQYRFESRTIFNECEIVGRLNGYETGKLEIIGGTVDTFNLASNVNSVANLRFTSVGVNATASVTVDTDAEVNYTNCYLNGAKVANTAWAA